PGPPSRAWRIQVVPSVLTLPELLESHPGLPPLLLDLKGRWPTPMIELLVRTLRARSRSGDAVCGTFADTVRRYGAADPSATAVFSARQLDLDAGLPERTGRRAAVSVKAERLLRRPDAGVRWR